jgi:hypothetical protein
MFFAVLLSIIIFTYWAYYRVVYKKEKEAWSEIEVVAFLIVVFLLLLYWIIK